MCARRLLQSFFLHSDVLRDTDLCLGSKELLPAICRCTDKAGLYKELSIQFIVLLSVMRCKKTQYHLYIDIDGLRRLYT